MGISNFIAKTVFDIGLSLLNILNALITGNSDDIHH